MRQSPADVPPALLASIWALFGLFVGSFLNVCIHRLPLEGESVSRPRRSRCPKCRTQLGWSENLPVLSWLLQRGRCRHCGVAISIRYPFVELFTAGLWAAAALAPGGEDVVLTGVRVVVLSGLVVATFVDFDWFEIPDEVSIGGMLLAPVASLAVPALHAASPVAMAASITGRRGVEATPMIGLSTQRGSRCTSLRRDRSCCWCCCCCSSSSSLMPSLGSGKADPAAA